jgi:hypothetical protein
MSSGRPSTGAGAGSTCRPTRSSTSGSGLRRRPVRWPRTRPTRRSGPRSNVRMSRRCPPRLTSTARRSRVFCRRCRRGAASARHSPLWIRGCIGRTGSRFPGSPRSLASGWWSCRPRCPRRSGCGRWSVHSGTSRSSAWRGRTASISRGSSASSCRCRSRA